MINIRPILNIGKIHKEHARSRKNNFPKFMNNLIFENCEE